MSIRCHCRFITSEHQQPLFRLTNNFKTQQMPVGTIRRKCAEATYFRTHSILLRWMSSSSVGTSFCSYHSHAPVARTKAIVTKCENDPKRPAIMLFLLPSVRRVDAMPTGNAIHLWTANGIRPPDRTMHSRSPSEITDRKNNIPKKRQKNPSKFEYSNEEAGRVRHHIKYSALILVFFVVPSSLTCRMEGNGARVGGMQIQNIMFCINYTFRLRATENMFCVAFANSQLLWLCDTPSALPRSVDMTIKTASVIFELLNGIFCHILRFYVKPLAYATQSTNGYATYGEINSAIWHRRQEEKKKDK